MGKGTEQMRRGGVKRFVKKELCCGCGACENICPTEALHMVRDREGFLYPKVDRSRCVHCSRCKEVCPIQKNLPIKSESQYFGVQAKREAIRYASSSGGFFSVLAEYVLRLHGVVYGAGYDKNMHVRHREITKLSQLGRIQKTKYVQSSMKGIYHNIEKYLKEKRWVLFCGTPCQAHALKLFLHGSCDKLILVDLVCYGVPSPGIWARYVKYLERRHKGKMRDFLFRDKRGRDNGHTCSYVINDREYAGSIYKDLYCALYFSNYILRPSCHKCKFCTVERSSDFTIGDFWGIERIRADVDDGMGTSLVIVHTDKAKEIWKRIKKDVDWFICEKQDILQPRLLTPTVAAKQRRLFMIGYSILPFSLTMKLVDRGRKSGKA